MARLTIEDKWWTDPRRSKLIKLLGGEDEADLAALRLWKLAQQFWGTGKQLIPFEMFDVLDAAKELVESRLAVVENDRVYTRGTEEFLSWLPEAREQASLAGKKGGKISASRPRDEKGRLLPVSHLNSPEKPTKRKRAGKFDQARDENCDMRAAETPNEHPSDIQAKPNASKPSGSVSDSVSGSGLDFDLGSAAVSDGLKEPHTPTAVKPSPVGMAWRAYSAAYALRYGENPTWNAKVAGQLKQFVARVPGDEAPLIAAFYLTHHGPRYVSSGHAVGMMLMDAEKLRTEWKTGVKITTQDARSAEAGDSLRNQIARVSGVR